MIPPFPLPPPPPLAAYWQSIFLTPSLWRHLPIVPLDNVSYVYLCLPMFTYTTHDHLVKIL